jgi:hypothetical protein
MIFCAYDRSPALRPIPAKENIHPYVLNMYSPASVGQSLPDGTGKIVA